MDDAIAVRDLVVDRGGRRVLHGISCAIPRGSGHRAARPQRQRQDHVHARGGRGAGGHRRHGHRAGPPGRRRRRCGAQVGYLTQAPSVYADLTVRENARYFAALHGRGRAEADQAIADVGLADAADPAGRHPLRRPAQPGLAGLRPGRRAGAGRPRRADRRAGPGAAGRPVGPVPRDGRGRHHPAGVQPRDGRGGPLRPAAADPRGAADRRRQPRPRSAPPPAPTTSTRRSCG